MKLVDLVLDCLERKGLKKIPIKVEYKRVDNEHLEARRYHARTGEKMFEPILLSLVPYNSKP